MELYLLTDQQGRKMGIYASYELAVEAYRTRHGVANFAPDSDATWSELYVLTRPAVIARFRLNESY